MPPSSAEHSRKVRSLDITDGKTDRVRNGIEDLYDDKLDVIVVRNAFPRSPLEHAGALLDESPNAHGWARPNARIPVEDIEVLGTDTPATPTYQEPRGASLQSYLESAKRHSGEVRDIFEESFDPTRSVENVLRQFSGGRTVDAAKAQSGDTYVPFTVRRLTDGKQIGLHHDYHYPLALYSELAPQVDTATLISYVTVLRRPEGGGELCVYGVTPDTPNPPKNGFAWDLSAVEAGYDSAAFTLDVGDFFLLASGRCLHRISPVRGPRARVTLGGFLALDRERQRVLYWS